MQKLLRFTYIFLFCFFAFTAAGQKGTLIQFGWDYPDVSQLSTNLHKMQHSPFDGICFSLQRQIMEAFDTTLRPAAYYQLDKLKQLKWGKYKDNFIILRGFGKMGGVWYDDNTWNTIRANTVNISKALNNTGIRGVLFDPEYYYEDQLYNPWTYTAKQYPAKTYKQVRAQVKKRGTQFIQALQTHRTEFSFLSIWITSLIVEDLKATPIEGTRHALLLPFIEGILEGKKAGVKVIDGNEYAYWYKKPSLFLESGAYLRKNLANLMQTPGAKAEALKTGIAQPLFYDGFLATVSTFDKGYSDEAKWKWFEENIKFAMAGTDDIVWFYNQRLNWWQQPVNDTLYQLLANNKAAQATNLSLQKRETIDGRLVGRIENINKGTGYLYMDEPNKPMQTGAAAFGYKLNRSSRKLNIDFRDKIPASVSIFINNNLYTTLTPGSAITSVTLRNFSRGKLVILAKYADKTEASAIEIYK